ncbi:MAG: hypothetical protein A2284_08170 [Deltaproteobacteria bacterium RIFOXYA12_FULL_61_11]|nr:MAG: hypothetical protein A2284_08170 [Deltaproteobacteria bacterium RIFOXYA12_FULL_61_11]
MATSLYSPYRPELCVWELTLACNLRCGHCGSSAGTARPDELTTAECLGLVDDLSLLGCRLITLSGGEPTLRPDWPLIARRIRSSGMAVNMVTNGLTMTEALAAEVREAGLANVAVSIDGPPEVHDEIRAKGSFQRALAALQTLRGAGVSTAIITTLHTLNLDYLDYLYRLAKDQGAAIWRLQLGKPMGNLAKHRDLTLVPEDYLELVPLIAELSRRGGTRVDVGDSIGYFGPHESCIRGTSADGRPGVWAGCQAGMRVIGIESDGGIKGCLSIQALRGENDPYREGSIREESLASIWHDPDRFAWNRKFRKRQLHGYCKRCDHAVRCRGGATCVATAFTGQVGDDPYCYHRVVELAREAASPPTFTRKVATTTAAVMLTLAGCSGDSQVTTDPNRNTSDLPLTPAQLQQTCAQVDCAADPSTIAPALFAQCCQTSADQPAQPGMPVQDGDDPTSPTPRAEYAAPAPIDQPDYGVAVPEYGVITPQPDYGVVTPDYGIAQPAYGVDLPPTQALDFDTLLKPFYSGLTTAQDRVIDNEADFAALWSDLTDNGPSATRPAVDFDTHLVIVTAMGEKPSGGYSTTITDLSLEGSRLRIEVEDEAPGACGASMAMTAPVHIILVERTWLEELSLPPRFVHQAVTADCDVPPALEYGVAVPLYGVSLP